MKIEINNKYGKRLKTNKTILDEDIEVVPVLQDLTITENGTYPVGEGYAGFGAVNVEVEGSGGGISDGYTVTFISEGEPYAILSVTAGQSINQPATPTSGAKDFIGWYTEESGGNLMSFPYTPSTNITLYAQYATFPAVGTSLEDCTWEQISSISAAGRGAEYFNIGDTKSVHLSGAVGTLALDTTLYVYIIGFNHNGGEGITFGTFKTAEGVDVALNEESSSLFTINHWCQNNYGGWSASDIRYDILGSTDVAPSDYGSAKTASSVGYDATATCATNPVENTLMSALPLDLRTVMKPMTIYTNNAGDSKLQVAVTATVDYLPLLAEYEIFGVRTNANQYEQDKQAQYEYFSNGNSKIKYKHLNTSSAAKWWERSASYYMFAQCCIVSSTGESTTTAVYQANALAPIFKV